MLFGSLTVGLGAAGAQADEDEGTYESPTYGYTLAWDAESFTVVRRLIDHGDRWPIGLGRVIRSGRSTR